MNTGYIFKSFILSKKKIENPVCVYPGLQMFQKKKNVAASKERNTNSINPGQTPPNGAEQSCLVHTFCKCNNHDNCTL